MKRETIAAVVGTIAFFVILALVVPPLLQKSSFVDLSEIDIQATPQPVIISKTVLELLYENNEQSMITIEADTFPITLTCELRKGGGEGTISNQEFNYITPCRDTYTEEPVVQPVTLTWTLSKSLPIGWYEEFCRLEALDGIYGWLPGGSPDGNNFFMINHWQIEPNRCYLPAIMRKRP
jgi:hypothetical protein